MIDLILDTNIVIYLLNRETKYIDFLLKNNDKTIGISVVTYMEILLGTNNGDEIEFLDNFITIPVSKDIAYQTTRIMKIKVLKSLRNPKSADLIIAATAITMDVPLVTNNAKDFKFIDKLDIVVP
jgi:tRNA(fMet)-specific endonuclease VapC